MPELAASLQDPSGRTTAAAAAATGGDAEGLGRAEATHGGETFRLGSIGECVASVVSRYSYFRRDFDEAPQNYHSGNVISDS